MSGVLTGREPVTGPAPAVPLVRNGSVLGPAELRAVAAVLGSGEPLSDGRHRREFERRFRESLGVGYALSTTSGTVALELAHHLLDLRPGDEVVVSPQTYQAMIQPLLALDAVVRFADVRPDTLNIDPASVERLLTARTRAIVLVDYGGRPADLGPILELAGPRGITVVEDCAHALGATDQGRPAGSRADIACFSFHSSKTVSTLGEGGMITFNRPDWAARIERLRGNEVDARFQAGADRRLGPSPDGALYLGNAYTHECQQVLRPGTNATLSEPAAAVGTVQLGRLPEFVARRRQIAAYYTELLAGQPGVRLARTPDGVEPAYHFFTFMLESDDGSDRGRRELLDRVRAAGILLEQRYFPLHLLPEWRSLGHGPGECPVAERQWFTAQVNLPTSPAMTDAQVDRLGDELTRALRSRA